MNVSHEEETFTFAVGLLRLACDNRQFRNTIHTEYLPKNMAMVRKYLDLAQSDDEAAHRRASPVDNWKL